MVGIQWTDGTFLHSLVCITCTKNGFHCHILLCAHAVHWCGKQMPLRFFFCGGVLWAQPLWLLIFANGRSQWFGASYLYHGAQHCSASGYIVNSICQLHDRKERKREWKHTNSHSINKMGPTQSWARQEFFPQHLPGLSFWKEHCSSLREYLVFYHSCLSPVPTVLATVLEAARWGYMCPLWELSQEPGEEGWRLG